MLRAFLFGPGRRGGTWGQAFSSWEPHLPPAGLLNATELVSHWTAVFEKRGIPEARESSEYIVAHVLGAKTVKCNIVKRVEGGREDLRKKTSGLFSPLRMLRFFSRNVLGSYLIIYPTNYYTVCQTLGVQG